jgi:hypothetical protein
VASRSILHRHFKDTSLAPGSREFWDAR